MSTPAYVDSESINQADGAQTSRVPVPLPDDPYVAVRIDSSHSSASLDSTAPLSPDHLLTHISPTPTHTRVSFHRRTAYMAVHVQPAMSPGLSASMIEALALSDLAFHKRYRSSYEKPSPSPPLPVWERYRGTSELILNTDSEWDKLGDEDTNKDESLDADAERDGLNDEDHRLDDEGLGLEGSEEVVVPEGQQRAAQVANTIVDPEDGRIYTNIPAYAPLVPPVQTSPSPEWSSGSLSISPSSLVAPSHIASPVATPIATIFINEDQFLESYTLGQEWFEMRSSHIGHVDTWMADMSWAGYDNHRLTHDMLVQQAALQRELQETRDRVTTLEQERDRREQ
ncbi:hypothetical protein Tco_0994121 [Tanacetum coccineum]